MNANKITQSLALAMSALLMAFAWAGKADLITGDMAMRLSMIVTGLVIAFYGNAIPKMVLRSAQARSARRFAGWAFVLSGLTCAVVWALAPIAVAKPVSIAMIASTVVLVFGVCMLSRRAARSD
jgi:uncharacterized membrane protein